MNLTQLVRKLEIQLKSAEKLTRQYDAQADALRKKLGSVASIVGQNIVAQVTAVAKAASPARKKRGAISAAGRARIIAAQQRRWANFRAQKAKQSQKTTPAPAAKKSQGKQSRGKLSPEGRARIVAAQRRRWSKAKRA